MKGMLVGVSMVKYTTSLPYIGLSERILKLYINFEFCEGENHKHLEKHIDIQSQVIYVAKTKFQDNSTYFRERSK